MNEYVGDQGIASHTDRDSFGEAIATISLIESWSMLFRGPLDEKIEVLLEKGSLAIMTGPSRHTHGVMRYQSENSKNNLG